MDASAKCAELHLYDVIGSGGIFSEGGITAKDVAEALRAAEGAAELTVFINSIGGDVFEGVAIHSQLERFPGKKTVVVDGLAASIASVIACAGDTIRTARSARWMVHEASTFVRGRASDLRKQADETERINGTMADLYAKRTGKSREECLAKMASETWFTAEEAKAFGLTDEIVDTAARVTAHAGHPFLAMFQNTPESLRSPSPPPAVSAPPAQERNMKALAALLGLVETASEQDLVADISNRLQTAKVSGEHLASLVALTGKASLDEAKGVFTAWKSDADKLPALAAKVQEIEEKAQTEKVEQLILSAKNEHRLTPADEPKAREFLAAHGFAAFSAHLAALHPIVTPAKKEPAVKADPAPAQSAVFKNLGIDPTPPAAK